MGKGFFYFIVFITGIFFTDGKVASAPPPKQRVHGMNTGLVALALLCFPLFFRQGFITDNQSLYSLVEKYLPLEYRQEIIPMVQAGNKIVLK